MAIGCGPKTAKFALFVFNGLFWLSGLILIIVGSYFLTNGISSSIEQAMNSNAQRVILILFIVVGSIIFIIGFCGCCGAIKESRCLLGTYIFLVCIIILVEVIFGILFIIIKYKFSDEFKTSFNNTISTKYGVPGSNNAVDTTITGSIDATQQLLKCCGVRGYEDWQNTKWFQGLNNKAQTVPGSCCIVKDDPCWVNIKDNNTYTMGCLPKVDKYIHENLPIAIGVVLGIAFFEIFVVICACCLCRNTDVQRQSV